jgi:hypothetical protein
VAAPAEPAKSYFEAITPAPALIQRPAGAPPALTAPASVPSAAADTLLQRLRNPASIREAIVLREVLGPPKAFQLG